jgi:hypothetical protein
MVQADNILDDVCQVYLAQAQSADHAMEQFCKEMEQGQMLKVGLHSKMNEMVESLWEDTDNLQEDMAKVMALAWANEAITAKMLQNMTLIVATTAALVTAVNDLIPMVQCQGALLEDVQRNHVTFQQDTLPTLTLTVCQYNAMLEEYQRDHLKQRQTISNIHHHVMSPTTLPPQVVLGMSTNIGSGACNQPCNTVLVGCDNEFDTPVELCQPPHNEVGTSGTMHVWHPPPCKTVSFSCKGGPLAKEFV